VAPQLLPANAVEDSREVAKTENSVFDIDIA
jgi:hypothetical protein